MGVLADFQIEREVKIEPFDDGRKKIGQISSGVTSYGYDARVGYKFKIFTAVNCAVIDPKNFSNATFVDVDITPKGHEYRKKGHGPASYWHCVHCGADLGDPNGFTGSCSRDIDHILIPPNSFALAESLETFTIPRDVLCVVMGKSTYARCGLILNTTPGEPEWTGKWTIELSNSTPLPIKVYAGEGIMQCVFLRCDGVNDAARRALSCHLTDGEEHSDYTKALAKGTCRTSYADKKGKYNHQIGLTPPKVDKEGE